MDRSTVRKTRPNSLRGSRLWLARGLLVMFSLTLCAATLEVGLRITGSKPQTATVLGTYYRHDPVLGWRGKPDVTCRFATTNFDVVIEHGRDGFRRAQEESQSKSGEQEPATVWVLGDSFTWGWGVAQGETYVDRLNQQSQGVRYRNRGQSGYSAVQEYLLLKELLEREERPAAVAVMFCINDLIENVQPERDRPYAQLQDGQVSLANIPVPTPAAFNAAAWLQNHSLAWNHVYFYAMRCRQAVRKTPTHPPLPTEVAGKTEWRPTGDYQPFLDDYWTQERLVVLKEMYSKMSDLCREQDIPFAVIGTPQHYGALAQICHELDVPFIDVSEPFTRHEAGPNRNQPWRFPTDTHCTELGNRLFAQAIQSQLDKIAFSGSIDRARAATRPSQSSTHR
ncbi:MAG: SGNH/GDSL hydrolase family protein [Planctomycetales bacterium]|nr:SGNH/GDSL hydrolase family protein [Planctomycetales bacterium]